jgi:hypothetical protein
LLNTVLIALPEPAFTSAASCAAIQDCRKFRPVAGGGIAEDDGDDADKDEDDDDDTDKDDDDEEDDEDDDDAPDDEDDDDAPDDEDDEKEEEPCSSSLSNTKAAKPGSPSRYGFHSPVLNHNTSSRNWRNKYASHACVASCAAVLWTCSPCS